MYKKTERRKRIFPVINVKMLFLDTVEQMLVSQPAVHLGLKQLQDYDFSLDLKYTTYFFNVVIGISYILGGWIADSYLGKFIVYLGSMFVHTICAISLLGTASMGSAYLDPASRDMILLTGYFMYALTKIGYGCRIPLLSEQFDMPQEKENLTVYYIYQFWLLNFAKCVSHIVIIYGLFNSNVFSKNVSFALYFTLAVLVNSIYVSVIIYFRRWFKVIVIKERSVEHSLIILYQAIVGKLFNKNKDPTVKQTCFDLIENEENREYVANTKTALGVLSVVAPCIGFYAGRHHLIVLWEALARQMDIDLIIFSLGPGDVTIVKNIITLILIPASVKLIAPLFRKFRMIFTSVTNIGMSFLLIVICLLMSTTFQFKFKYSDWKQLGTKETAFTFFNGLTSDCVVISNKWLNSLTIKPFDMISIREKYKENTDIIIKCENYEWKDSNAGGLEAIFSYNIVSVKEKDELNVFKHNITDYYQEKIEPTLLFYCSMFPKCSPGQIELLHLKSSWLEISSMPLPNDISVINLPVVGSYKLNIAGEFIPTDRFISGATYVFYITETNSGKIMAKRFELVPPFSVHIGWLIPQFFIASVADILAYVNIDVFVYTQSPVPLRALISTIAQCIRIVGEGLLSLFINKYHVEDMVYQYHFAIVISSFFIIYAYSIAKYQFRTIYEEDY